jgi:hypothetical protein
MNLFGQSVGLLGRRISPTQGLYPHRTTQHRKTRTHIHAPNGIRTRDPSVRAVEDSTCLRPRGRWNRQSKDSIDPKWTKIIITSKLLMQTPPKSGADVARLWAGRQGFNSQQGQWWDFFLSPQRPERLWGPPSLLSNGHRGSYPRGKATGAWIWPLISI